MLYFSVSPVFLKHLSLLYILCDRSASQLAEIFIKMGICSTTVMSKPMALLAPLFLIRFSFSPRKGTVSSSRVVVYPDSSDAIRHLHCIFLLEAFQSPYYSKGTSSYSMPNTRTESLVPPAFLLLGRLVSRLSQDAQDALKRQFISIVADSRCPYDTSGFVSSPPDPFGKLPKEASVCQTPELSPSLTMG